MCLGAGRDLGGVGGVLAGDGEVGDGDAVDGRLVEPVGDRFGGAGHRPVGGIAGVGVGVGRLDVERLARARVLVVLDGDRLAGLRLYVGDARSVQRRGGRRVVVDPVVDLGAGEGDLVEREVAVAVAVGVLAGVPDGLQPHHGLERAGVLGIDSGAANRVDGAARVGVHLPQVVAVDRDQLVGVAVLDVDLGGDVVQSCGRPERGRGDDADIRRHLGGVVGQFGLVGRVAVQVPGDVRPVRCRVVVQVPRRAVGEGGRRLAALLGGEGDLRGRGAARLLVGEAVAVGDRGERAAAGVRGEGAGVVRVVGRGRLATAEVVVAGLGGVVVALHETARRDDEVQVPAPALGLVAAGLLAVGVGVAGVRGPRVQDGDAPGRVRGVVAGVRGDEPLGARAGR